jgi:hypothetical protein
VTEFFSNEQTYSWERLKNQANRISKNDLSNPVHQLCNEFIKNTDQGLKMLYQNVPHETIAQYKKEAKTNIIETISRYLY